MVKFAFYLYAEVTNAIWSKITTVIPLQSSDAFSRLLLFVPPRLLLDAHTMHTRGNMIPYTTLSKTRCKSEFCYKRNEINDASIDDSSGRVMIDASDGVQIRERKGSFKLRLRAPLPHSATNLSPVKELVYVMFATSRDQKLLHRLALSGQLGESNVRLKPLMWEGALILMYFSRMKEWLDWISVFISKVTEYK